MLTSSAITAVRLAMPARATASTPATSPPAARRRCILSLSLFQGPSLKHCLAREPDLTLVDPRDHHQKLIAHIGNVGHLFNTGIRKLRDVNQSIRSRHDLHERAKVGNPYHLPVVHLAEFGRLHHRVIVRQGALRPVAIRRRDENGAVFLNIDLDSVLGLQGPDVLATGADQRS